MKKRRMREVPSVLHYVGNCIADFSSNCVHTLGLMKAAWSLARCIQLAFSWNCTQTLLNYERQYTCSGDWKATEFGGWLRSLTYTKLDLTLNWIYINKLRLQLIYVQLESYPEVLFKAQTLCVYAPLP